MGPVQNGARGQRGLVVHSHVLRDAKMPCHETRGR